MDDDARAAPHAASGDPPAVGGIESLRALADELEGLLEVEARARREERLEALHARDPALAHRLEQALEAIEDDRFLSTPCAELRPDLITASASIDTIETIDEASWIGAHVGRWLLEGPIGRGGMGSVFRARRADGVFEQDAAVKLLASRHPGFDRLFLAERQNLARLDHPNVARLIDGGAAEDGTLFLVTELVDGEPLDRWTERRGLGVPDRLRLFLDVCGAVTAAHRQLLVHGDLKPANVLVTDDGVVKLLDFGVARLIEDEELGVAGEPTPLTVAYAAPEQLAQEPVSVTTDVYALGCLLSRLLAGRSPHERAELVREGGRLRRRGDAVPPVLSALAAATTGGRRLARRLRGDLDAIVARCLAEDPLERYASVRELAEDVERHLDHRPVRARDGGRVHRMERALRRHPLAASLVLLAILATLAGGLALSKRAREAEARAEQARRVVAFVEEVLRPEAFGAARVEPAQLLSAGAATARRRFTDEPEVEAGILESLGAMLTDLEAYGPAREALARAVELRRAERDAPALVRALGLHGWAVGQSGDRERGLELLDEAVDEARRRAGERSIAFADALHAHGFHLLRYLGSGHPRFEQARPELERAAALYRELLAPTDERIAGAEFDVGLATPDSAEAIPRLLAAIDGLRHADGADPETIAHALGDLALVYESAGLQEQAVETARESVHAIGSLTGASNLGRLKLVNNLAGILRDAERYAEALPLYEDVLERRRRLIPHDGGALAYPLYGLGRVHLGLGRADLAEPYLREALELIEERGWWQRALAVRLALAESLLRLDRHREAEQIARAALEELAAKLPASGLLEQARALLEQAQREPA